MRNFVNSEINGVPVLTVRKASVGCSFTLEDSAGKNPSAHIDVWAPDLDVERMRRAADAFNAVMREVDIE